jgi:hypothetical protein
MLNLRRSLLALLVGLFAAHLAGCAVDPEKCQREDDQVTACILATGDLLASCNSAATAQAAAVCRNNALPLLLVCLDIPGDECQTD